MNSLNSSFQKYCENLSYERNANQIEIVDLISKFLSPKKSFFNFFNQKDEFFCFYLYGNVGVGKTMISDFIYSSLEKPKKRIHFNEFMIDFHDLRHSMKNDEKHDSIHSFVKRLKKYDLVYLDELQVTNIVDAMILGKLFEVIFSEKIKIIITSNTKVEDLYKDGLQREQFLPFISIIKKNSIEKELVINNDYRKIGANKLKRAFYPNNQENLFKINQIFRSLTKNKKRKEIKLNVKGRNFEITNYYEGIARLDFNDICNKNLGAEDYLSLAEKCNFIVIENIPKFNENNSNQQQRFITLIDILYEKKIPLMISLSVDLEKIGTSEFLKKTFQRTSSRIYELTSPELHLIK
tara:strand:+ start:1037 stop:2089 length:1053 start_codon:yes stop_codon:yes gene_type:complete